MIKSVALLAGAFWCLACKDPTTSHPRAIVSNESLSTSQTDSQTEEPQTGQAPQGDPAIQGTQGAAQPLQAQGAAQTGAAKPLAGQNPSVQTMPQSGTAQQNTTGAAGGRCAVGFEPVRSTTVFSLADPDCWSAAKDGGRVGYYAKGSLLCMRSKSVQPVRSWRGTWHVIEVQVTLKGQTTPTQCWTECKYTLNRAVACGICDECV